MASNVTEDMQDQVLNTIRKSQEIALEALKTWVETVQAIAPKVPNVSLPLVDKLPNPHEVVSSGYKFAEQILANQKKFADDVIQAAGPLLPLDGAVAK